MPHFAGLDVSLETTHVCIMDEKGEAVRQGITATDPAAIEAFLRGNRRRYGRVILEAGPMCQWLYKGLAKRGLPVVCIEARHASAVLKTRPNKTDRNDAHGLAELARTAHFRPVHIKTDESLRARAALATRRVLLSKLVDIEAAVRGIIQPFGFKVGHVTRRGYAARVRSLLAGDRALAEIIEPILQVRAQIAATFDAVHKKLLVRAKEDPICQRLMTAPGVGPLVALTYRAAIDIPERFARSRDVGPHLGLTPRTQQSGVTGWRSRISKCGDKEARQAMFVAARAMLPVHRRKCELQTWGRAIKDRAGGMKAMVAVARRLSVILHRIWIDETEFRWEVVDR
ncbi:MAG: transposase family protein [Caulobacter sp.]|nr:transposase family protein [Caulobacter sp.]